MKESAHVAPFGLGCVALGSAAAGGPAAGVRLVHHALDAGVTFFDTADAYGAGTSERVLGTALRGRRHLATVATKAGYLFRERPALERMVRRLAAPVLAARSGRAAPPVAPVSGPAVPTGAYAARDLDPAYLRRALEGSLRRLRTDHVDVFQLHGPPAVCGDDVAALMADLRAEGKIRGFGVGLESLEHALGWLEVGGLDWMQLPYGVLDPEAGARVLPAAAARGVQVVARGVLAAGLLADLSPAATAQLRPGQAEQRRAFRELAARHGVDPVALAVAYVRTRPAVATVLIGTSRAAHLDAHLADARTPPPPAALAAVDALLAGQGADGATPPTEASA